MSKSWIVGRGEKVEIPDIVLPTRRFWLQQGADREIIFLTSETDYLVLYEHQVNVGGSWNNYATCLRGTSDDVTCPLCDYAMDHSGKFRAYVAGFFTVVDATEFTDRAGKVHKNVRRLFVAKNRTLELLKHKCAALHKKKLGLKYAQFNVHRTSDDKSPSVGNDFEYVHHIEPAVLPEAEELDLEKELAPNVALMRSFIRRLEGKTVGSDEGTSDEVPF